MSAGGETAVVAAADWHLDVEAGDPVSIFNNPYIFERVDPDHTVTFRAPAHSGGGDFMIQGADGRPRKPFVNEVGALMAAGDLIWREKPLSRDARRHARAQELDAEQARSLDPKCKFRMAIARRFDASPWSKSDAGLIAFMKDAMLDPKIAAMEGAWHASPATIRDWLRTRGTEGCRKERDGISMKNRMPKMRKLKHPLEILFYHAARATNVRGSIRMNYQNYVAEIAKINAGEPLNRDFWIEPSADHVGELPA